MKTIQTKHGAMNLYERVEELSGFSYEDCVNWLQFNDSNGCYSIEDQMDEFGEILKIEVMKEIILDQCLDALIDA